MIWNKQQEIQNAWCSTMTRAEPNLPKTEQITRKHTQKPSETDANCPKTVFQILMKRIPKNMHVCTVDYPLRAFVGPSKIRIFVKLNEKLCAISLSHEVNAIWITMRNVSCLNRIKMRRRRQKSSCTAALFRCAFHMVPNSTLSAR